VCVSQYLGAAFAVLGAFKLATTWFSADRFAFITGLTVAIGTLGAVTAGAPLAFLVQYVGWRHTMLILGLIGLFIALLMGFIIRDYPPTNEDRHKPEKKTQAAPKNKLSRAAILPSLRYIFSRKQNWLAACYGGLMFAPTSAFAGLWGVPFLMAKYSLSRPVAALAISMIFMGWVVGSPLFGWLSDSIKRRKPSLYFGSIGALITALIMIYVTIPLAMLYVVLFLFGFCSAGFLPAFSLIRESNPPHINATVLSFMNMLNMIGGALLQPLIGWILDRNWTGQIIDHTRTYGFHAYYHALFIIPLILLCSLIILPFVKETYCKQANEINKAPPEQ